MKLKAGTPQTMKPTTARNKSGRCGPGAPGVGNQESRATAARKLKDTRPDSTRLAHQKRCWFHSESVKQAAATPQAPHSSMRCQFQWPPESRHRPTQATPLAGASSHSSRRSICCALRRRLPSAASKVTVLHAHVVLRGVQQHLALGIGERAHLLRRTAAIEET